MNTRLNEQIEISLSEFSLLQFSFLHSTMNMNGSPPFAAHGTNSTPNKSSAKRSKIGGLSAVDESCPMALCTSPQNAKPHHHMTTVSSNSSFNFTVQSPTQNNTRRMALPSIQQIHQALSDKACTVPMVLGAEDLHEDMLVPVAREKIKQQKNEQYKRYLPCSVTSKFIDIHDFGPVKTTATFLSESPIVVDNVTCFMCAKDYRSLAIKNKSGMDHVAFYLAFMIFGLPRFPQNTHTMAWKIVASKLASLGDFVFTPDIRQQIMTALKKWYKCDSVGWVDDPRFVFLVVKYVHYLEVVARDEKNDFGILPVSREHITGLIAKHNKEQTERDSKMKEMQETATPSTVATPFNGAATPSNVATPFSAAATPSTPDQTEQRLQILREAAAIAERSAKRTIDQTENAEQPVRSVVAKLSDVASPDMK